jgi:type IV pilus assembly protein PilM
MQILSSTLGKQLRPRLACELRPEGIVAAAGASANGALSRIAWEPLPDGALQPSLHAGNLVDPVRVASAIESALGSVADSSRDVTLILPDACVRVLLVDFDSLPHKQSEALPIVSFRLKKLLPFEVEEASVSYQVLSSSKSQVRVLAVAIHKQVLTEFESAVRTADYEPGAVLPSTLAALAALDDSTTPTLLVNANNYGVTTAIVHAGELQLHRAVGFTTGVVHGEETESAPRSGVAVQTPAATLLQHAAEIVQTVNIVSAWSEDTLGAYPGTAYAAGSYPAAAIQEIFSAAATFNEVVGSSHMLAEAATANVPRHWLAGVLGALRIG